MDDLVFLAIFGLPLAIFGVIASRVARKKKRHTDLRAGMYVSVGLAIVFGMVWYAANLPDGNGGTPDRIEVRNLTEEEFFYFEQRRNLSEVDTRLAAANLQRMPTDDSSRAARMELVGRCIPIDKAAPAIGASQSGRDLTERTDDQSDTLNQPGEFEVLFEFTPGTCFERGSLFVEWDGETAEFITPFDFPWTTVIFLSLVLTPPAIGAGFDRVRAQKSLLVDERRGLDETTAAGPLDGSSKG